jgi:hypothetical protein
MYQYVIKKFVGMFIIYHLKEFYIYSSNTSLATIKKLKVNIYFMQLASYYYLLFTAYLMMLSMAC